LVCSALVGVVGTILGVSRDGQESTMAVESEVGLTEESFLGVWRQ
jgi:hypothetical protein